MHSAFYAVYFTLGARMSATESQLAFFTGAVFGAIVVGLICGLIPLAIGAITHQKRSAVISFFACLFASLLGGAVVAVPTALVFSIVLLIKWQRAPNKHDESAKPGT